MATVSSCNESERRQRDPQTHALYLLDDHRQPLSDTDAHSAEGIAPVAVMQLARRGQYKACTGHAERMPERDGATVGVHVLGIVRQTELTQDSERLGS